MTMSHRQFATLRFVQNHDIFVDHVRAMNLTTFGSLLHHGWVQRIGNQIVVTLKGERALDQYTKSGPNYRKIEGPVSQRVSLMLHLRLTKGAA